MEERSRGVGEREGGRKEGRRGRQETERKKRSLLPVANF